MHRSHALWRWTSMLRGVAFLWMVKGGRQHPCNPKIQPPTYRSGLQNDSGYFAQIIIVAIVAPCWTPFAHFHPWGYATVAWRRKKVGGSLENLLQPISARENHVNLTPWGSLVWFKCKAWTSLDISKKTVSWRHLHITFQYISVIFFQLPPEKRTPRRWYHSPIHRGSGARTLPRRIRRKD